MTMMTPEEFNRKFRRAFWSNAVDMLALLGSKPENITELELITRKVIVEMTAPGEPLMNGYPPDFEFPPAERDVPLAPHNDELIGRAYQDFAREQCPSCKAKAREVEVVEQEGRTILIADERAERIWPRCSQGHALTMDGAGVGTCAVCNAAHEEQAAKKQEALRQALREAVEREEEVERLKAEEVERLVESTPKL